MGDGMTSAEAVGARARDLTARGARVLETELGRVWYLVKGTGNAAQLTDGSAPTLVFLPGLTADHRLFERQLAHFAPRYRCLVWDPPSHGNSRPFACMWSMDDLARTLRAVIERERIERPVIIGQSMGGYVAQAYLNLYPGEASGFVSIDSCPLGRAYYTVFELWALRHTRGMYAVIPWRALLAIGSFGVAQTAYGRALMRTMMEGYTKEEYLDLAACGYRALADAVAANRPYVLGCPALLIYGERDAAGSAKRYNRAWARRTGLPAHEIKGAGHNANADAPDEVNTLIGEFVGRLPRGC